MFFNILEQVNYNLYSYSPFVVMGIIIYLLYEICINKIFKNVNDLIKNIIPFMITVSLPFCSCIAITFLLYRTSEKNKIILYTLALFIKVPVLLLIKTYFGLYYLYSYIFIIIFILLYLIITSNKKININANIIINGINDNTENKFIIKDAINNVVRFVYIYFLSLVMMSVIEVIIPNILFIKYMSYVENIRFNEVLFISITKYICMPNDLSTFAMMVASGLNIKYVSLLIIVGSIFNITEIIIILIFIKKKILLIIYYLLAIVTSLIHMIIIDIFYKNSFNINYDLSKTNNYVEIVNILNINPNNLFRWISVIIILLVVAYNIYLLLNNINNRKDC